MSEDNIVSFGPKSQGKEIVTATVKVVVSHLGVSRAITKPEVKSVLTSDGAYEKYIGKNYEMGMGAETVVFTLTTDGFFSPRRVLATATLIGEISPADEPFILTLTNTRSTWEVGEGLIDSSGKKIIVEDKNYSLHLANKTLNGGICSCKHHPSYEVEVLKEIGANLNWFGEF